MLLRRFMVHVREQNWLAVPIDVVVVFGSVVFAIRFSQALDRRRDEARFRDSMLAILGEIRSFKDTVDRGLDTRRRNLRYLRDALLILQGEERLRDYPEQELLKGLSHAVDPLPITTPFDATRSLQHSGRLNDWRIPEIRNNLITLLWYATALHQLGIVNASKGHTSLGVRDLGSFGDFVKVSAAVRESDMRTAWGHRYITSIDWTAARANPDFLYAVATATHRQADYAHLLEGMQATLEATLQDFEDNGYPRDATDYDRWLEDFRRIVTARPAWTPKENADASAVP
ncbi:MAG: hypothetical protein AAFY29_22045 [Pseudomonadota bacterium]